MTMSRLMGLLQKAYEDKRGKKPVDGGEEVSTILQGILKGSGAKQGLQILASMFNVKITIVDERGIEKEVINPKETPSSRAIAPLSIVLGRQGFSETVPLSQTIPPPERTDA